MKAKCGHDLYWHGMYRGTYDLIAPDSFAHLAKMSPALCYRILQHLQELGLLKEGDTVLDPMAGTGITNICAGAMGYPSISVELEGKFVNFQEQNKEYAERRLYKELDWRIIQGDSRNLSGLLQGQGLKSVMSSPYEDSEVAIRLPSGANPEKRKELRESKEWDGYGITEGQIGNLKDAPLKAITSPPYGEAVNADKGGIDWEKAGRPDRLPENNPAPSVQGTQEWRYSKDKENIGNLPDKPLKTLTSPPSEDAKGDKHHSPRFEVLSGDKSLNETYTERGAENIGNEKAESYLSAMLQVYSEIAKVSDVLVVVVKNPTRAGKLRRLDLDTIKIMEMAGWGILCQHRALLFEELEQETLFGDRVKRVKGRLSFFKRLSWQNGQPVASWEDVIVGVRRN